MAVACCNFIITLFALTDVLSVILPASRLLQSYDRDIAKAFNIIDGIIHNLSGKRYNRESDFSQLFEQRPETPLLLLSAYGGFEDDKSKKRPSGRASDSRGGPTMHNELNLSKTSISRSILVFRTASKGPKKVPECRSIGFDDKINVLWEAKINTSREFT
ncbi:hypothetical protein QTP88_019973 [Uroleucon formosanum]